jgi:hypothetical protein
MVASKDTRIYTGSGRSPTSCLKDDRVCVPRLDALKFLQWGGARMVEGVGDGARARRWTA